MMNAQNDEEADAGGRRRVRVRRKRHSKSPLKRLSDIAFLILLAGIVLGAGLAWLLTPPSPGEAPAVEAPPVEG